MELESEYNRTVKGTVEICFEITNDGILHFILETQSGINQYLRKGLINDEQWEFLKRKLDRLEALFKLASDNRQDEMDQAEDCFSLQLQYQQILGIIGFIESTFSVEDRFIRVKVRRRPF